MLQGLLQSLVTGHVARPFVARLDTWACGKIWYLSGLKGLVLKPVAKPVNHGPHAKHVARPGIWERYKALGLGHVSGPGTWTCYEAWYLGLLQGLFTWPAARPVTCVGCNAWLLACWEGLGLGPVARPDRWACCKVCYLGLLQGLVHSQMQCVLLSFQQKLLQSLLHSHANVQCAVNHE
jgi:hypothetical protein